LIAMAASGSLPRGPRGDIRSERRRTARIDRGDAGVRVRGAPTVPVA
jgi:hypothetical protein